MTEDLNDLHARFREQIDPTIPIVYDNAAPFDGSGLWARFTIRPGATKRASFEGLTHSLGRIYIQICAPKGTRDGTATALAQTVSAIFNNYRSTDGKLFCETAQYSIVDDPEWFMVSVQTAYQSYR